MAAELLLQPRLTKKPFSSKENSEDGINGIRRESQTPGNQGKTDINRFSPGSPFDRSYLSNNFTQGDKGTTFSVKFDLPDLPEGEFLFSDEEASAVSPFNGSLIQINIPRTAEEKILLLNTLEENQKKLDKMAERLPSDINRAKIILSENQGMYMQIKGFAQARAMQTHAGCAAESANSSSSSSSRSNSSSSNTFSNENHGKKDHKHEEEDDDEEDE